MNKNQTKLELEVERIKPRFDKPICDVTVRKKSFEFARNVMKAKGLGADVLYFEELVNTYRASEGFAEDYEHPHIVSGRILRPYRDKNEMGKFGSDLNKVVSGIVSKNGFSIINADMIIKNYDKKIFKIIESKHVKEAIMGYGQRKTLKDLDCQFGESSGEYKAKVFIVVASPPYNNFEVEEIRTETRISMDEDQFRKFINDEIDYF